MAEQVEKATPAYFPWRTFENFVANLKRTAVPPVVDDSVMRTMSGSTQSQVRTGLRFLGLTTEGDAVTDRFKKLIAAHGEEEAWQEELSQVITDAYRDIMEGLDTGKGTHNQLVEHFREQGGATGSVLTKSVRFFLAAMKSAGWTASPHFAGKSGASNGNTSPKPRRRRQAKPPAAERPPRGAPPPPGTERIQLPIPGKSDAIVHVPDGITEREWQMVDTYVRWYIGAKGAK